MAEKEKIVTGNQSPLLRFKLLYIPSCVIFLSLFGEQKYTHLQRFMLKLQYSGRILGETGRRNASWSWQL